MKASDVEVLYRILANDNTPGNYHLDEPAILIGLTDAQIIINNELEILLNIQESTLLANQNIYLFSDIAANIERIKQIWIEDKRLKEEISIEHFGNNWISESGTPDKYFITNDKIIFSTIPDSDISIKVVYIQHPGTIQNLTDDLIVNENFKDALIDYLFYLYYKKELDVVQENNYYQNFYVKLSKIKIDRKTNKSNKRIYNDVIDNYNDYIASY